nr:TlpA family protein disulfide reductase [Chloroflexota bacterium]
MSTSADRPPRRNKRASLLWVSGLLALTALLLVLVLLPLGRGSVTGRGSLVGKPVPILEAVDLAGKRWTMTAGEGRLTWINFWATWCPPCRTEMPMMQRLAEAYGDRLLILGVDYGEEPGAVRDFVDRYGITYP